MGSPHQARGAAQAAARPVGAAALESAGLAALTTTLLAGAVSGAVAGVIEQREADRLAGQHGQVSLPEAGTDAAPTRPEGGPGGIAAGRVASSPDDAAGPDRAAPDSAPAAPLPEEAAGPLAFTPGPAGHAAPSGAPTPASAPATATSGDESHAPVALAASPQAAPPAAADHAGPDAGAMAPAGGIVGTALDRGLDSIAVTNDLTQGLASLDAHLHAVGAQTQQVVDGIAEVIGATTEAITERLADTSAAVLGQAAEMAQTLAAKISVVDDVAQGAVASVAAISETLTAPLANTLAAAIPATILGAENDERPAGGLLARLFDTDVATVALSAPADGAADHLAFLSGQDDAFLPDIAGTIDMIRIDFAGQSYAAAPDAHDGGANLLHGLL